VPQIYLATSEIIEGAEEKLDLTQETVQDIDFKKIVFENGVKLNVKQTPYQEDVISISVALAGGELFMPRDEPGLRVFAPNALSLSGLEAHTVDDIRKIMAGRSVGVSQNIGAKRIFLNGTTVPEDLDLQLDLMTAQLTAQGYRPEAKSQYDKYIKSFYPTLDSTPGGVASRDIPRLIRSGDTRFGFPSEDEMLRVDIDQVKAWREAMVAGSAIEIGIVGDITPERAIEAVSASNHAKPCRRRRDSFIAYFLASSRWTRYSNEPRNFNDFEFVSLASD